MRVEGRRGELTHSNGLTSIHHGNETASIIVLINRAALAACVRARACVHECIIQMNAEEMEGFENSKMQYRRRAPMYHFRFRILEAIDRA